MQFICKNAAKARIKIADYRLALNLALGLLGRFNIIASQ